LGLPRAIIKSHPEEKSACPWARRAPTNWGFLFNIYATTEGSYFKIGRLVGFAKAHHKILPGRKIRRGPGLGERYLHRMPSTKTSVVSYKLFYYLFR